MNSPKRFETTKELPLELASALDTLSRLQHEATVGVTKLLSYVNPQWRVRDKLEPVLMDVKLAVVRLKTSLHDLAEFAEGTLGNAIKTEDKRKTRHDPNGHRHSSIIFSLHRSLREAATSRESA